MAIPLATTSITVYRPTVAEMDAEPYTDETNAQRVAVARNVRAVIGILRGSPGSEYLAGGEMTVNVLKLTCDIPPSGIDHRDVVVDDSTGVEYQVKAVFENRAFGLDHVVAEIQRIEGAR